MKNRNYAASDHDLEIVEHELKSLEAALGRTSDFHDALIDRVLPHVQGKVEEAGPLPAISKGKARRMLERAVELDGSTLYHIHEAARNVGDCRGTLGNYPLWLWANYGHHLPDLGTVTAPDRDEEVAA